jgi:2-polyprenyl-3-methyl-5-hydroxy-6-metoxy-1,4-benzoquinol methylase
MTSTLATPHLLVDAHIHLHDCFDLGKFFTAARNNFQQQSRQLGLESTAEGVLLLAEVRGMHAFERLKQTRSQLNEQLRDWTIEPTSEAMSLRVTHTDGQSLLLVSGRQVVTQEGIEVLTLMTPATVEDGLSLEETLNAAIAADSLTVLPWGVGKWLGKRGQLVRDRLEASLPGSLQANPQANPGNTDPATPLFAGDNGGRPSFWPLPSFCQQRPQLPGSDPLPLAGEVQRPGSFGFVVAAPADWREHAATPGQRLKAWLQSAWLQNDQTLLQPYGRSPSPWQFLKNQSLLRINKKLNKSPSQPLNQSTPASADKPTESTPTITSPFPETADIETSTDAYASRFAGPIGAWLLKIQSDATLKMLRAYPNASVLEVGGGHGQLTPGLIAAGHPVTVVGSDESCEKRIRQWVEAGQCNFQVGNVLALPYPDNAFDVVISYRFLAHVDQWQAFVKELSRVSKTAVLVDYPTLRSVNYITPLLFNLKKGAEKNTRPYTCYNEAELLDYAKTLGLSVGDRYAQFFWPMVLHRILKKPLLSALLEGSARTVGLSRLFGSPIILKWIHRESA